MNEPSRSACLKVQEEVVRRHGASRKEVLRQPTVLLQKVVRVLLVHEDVDCAKQAGRTPFISGCTDDEVAARVRVAGGREETGCAATTSIPERKPTPPTKSMYLPPPRQEGHSCAKQAYKTKHEAPFPSAVVSTAAEMMTSTIDTSNVATRSLTVPNIRSFSVP